MPLGLDVHLGDQRAGGVEIDHLPLHRFGRHRLRYAVSGEHHRPVVGTLLQLLDEHRPYRAQAVDHMAVVHDLVAHIDRRAVLLDRPFDDLDRAVDPGAKTAGTGKQDFDGAAHDLAKLGVSTVIRQPRPRCGPAHMALSHAHLARRL